MINRLVLFAPAALLLVSCGRAPEQRVEASASPASIPVQVAAVTAEDWPREYIATGTVRARTTAALSARINAHVLEVRAREGDAVAAGQVLVTLDARELDIGLKRAEAMQAEAAAAVPELDAALEASKSALDFAEATFRRMSQLNAEKSISAHEFDEAQSRVKAARAEYQRTLARKAQVQSRIDAARQEVQSARVNQDYTRITAPFAGVVTARNVEPGALATAGAPLLTIEQAGAFRLEANVEESRAGLVRNGAPARFSIDSVDCKGEGRVQEVVPSVDPGARSYVVKIPLPCPGLRSGMFGSAVFAGGARRVLSIPENVAVASGQLQSAFVLEQGVAHRRLVTLGEHRAGSVEVLSGLSSGERVIVDNPPALTDGAKVEVKQ